MPSNPDLTLLRPGVRVKLRGDKSADKRKPWPRGWRTVEETLPRYSMIPEDNVQVQPVTHIRVESDERWLPIELIEEIAP